MDWLFPGFFAQPLTLDLIAGNFWMQLLLANITLVVFNVIPAFPMDGGRMLRALLAMVMSRVKATKVAAGVGRGFAVLMGVLGMFFNTWLILTSIYVWWSAGAEAQAETIKAGLDGLSVRDVLVNLFYQVEANQPLTTVFQLTASTGQRDMPVTSNGHYPRYHPQRRPQGSHRAPGHPRSGLCGNRCGTSGAGPANAGK